MYVQICQLLDSQECSSKSSSNVNTRPPKGSGKRKAPAASVATTPAEGSVPQTPTLAESLSYLSYPRPFKNPNYTKNAARRTRTLKSVLAQERERERIERERRRAEREAAARPATEASLGDSEDGNGKDAEQMDVDEAVTTEAEVQRKTNVTAVLEEEDIPTYTSIEAAPSILPQKRYCDITGLEAPYTDPATGLRYHDKSIYEFIKTLNMSSVKDYLALRGVNPIVK